MKRTVTILGGDERMAWLAENLRHGNREPGDCAGGTDSGRQWGRYLLELVWIFQQRGMVCLLRKLVCRSVRIY